MSARVVVLGSSNTFIAAHLVPRRIAKLKPDGNSIGIYLPTAYFLAFRSFNCFEAAS
jgi:hypothetical protein